MYSRIAVDSRSRWCLYSDSRLRATSKAITVSCASRQRAELGRAARARPGRGGRRPPRAPRPLSTASHHGVRQNAIRGASAAGVSKPASSAASATVRPNVPSVSRRALRRLMPSVERPAVARLEAGDAAERGGADHRAGGLRAVGERDHPVGYGGGRAARGAAGRARRVVRVDGRRRLVGGELGRHGLAEDHRALLAQPGHAVRVAGRAPAGVDRRAVGGRHVGGVDDVLDADRQAVQRPARLLVVALPRRRDRLVGVDVRPRVQLALALADPLQALAHELLGAQLAFIEEPDGLGRRDHPGRVRGKMIR